MRRGLMAWDADEIPILLLRERIQRLQSAMAAAGQDAMILYTNFVRSAAVSYLTAFSPYWADGMLLVPREGEPVFSTTLSKRVGSWIQAVKPVGELVTSPTPGTVLGKRLAESAIHRLAILEIDAFPSGLYGELTAALPGIQIVDGSAVFAAARGCLDDVERGLLERAQTIARDALDRLRFDTYTDVGRAVGTIEEYARARGAEEVYIAIAPDLDADRRFLRLSGGRSLGSRFAIRATAAYKGCWVRRTKTYTRNSEDELPIRRADSWFENLIERIEARRPPGEQIASAVPALPGAQLVSWIAEGPVGTRPLAVVASSAGESEPLQRVPAFIVTVALNIDGVPWCGAGLADPARGNS
jgi:Creatinase/Prolidase N-terminal domain